MLSIKKDYSEKNKGHSYRCLSITSTYRSITGLIFEMGLHTFKRYWRSIWLAFIVSGIFLIIYSTYSATHRPVKIIEDRSSINDRIVHEKHQTKKKSEAIKSDERAEAFNHPKPLKTEKKKDRKSKDYSNLNVENEQQQQEKNEDEEIEKKKTVQINKSRNEHNIEENVDLNKGDGVAEIVVVPKHDEKLLNDQNGELVDKEIKVQNRLTKLQKLLKKKAENDAEAKTKVELKIKARMEKIKHIENVNKNPALNPNLIKTFNETTNILKTNEKKQIQNFPNYYEDNLRGTWNFKIPQNYDEQMMHLWSTPIQNLSLSEIPGQTDEGGEKRGENGTAYVPLKDDLELMKKLQNENNYNVFASERMSLHRTLPDVRSSQCKAIQYPLKLPTTSVIIVVHNEIWSTLLRTVWSIIDRSPKELLKEIILVDDASTWVFLKHNLVSYVSTLPVPVRVIRLNKREGLIKARLLGAASAQGNILTFFDAHMEVTEGWLPPILSRIASDRSVVAVPRIEYIRSDDMAYETVPNLEVNGLRWHLIFNWMPVSQREILRRKNDPTAPVRAPTHVGCGFSIDREFFFEIGSYDEGMAIWGSENVEMALRVWMCGGSLEVIPCSHVGHLYRISTYSFDGDSKLITARNNNRLVEVWLDEFKEYFYAANPGSRNVSPGNISDRIELRKRLQCKSFRWYLENIFPESTWLKEYNMMGELKNVGTKTCLDIGTTALYDKLMSYPCHGYGGNQFFAFAKSGQIVTAEEICVGIKETQVILVPCSEEDKSQLWNYDDKEQWILHRETNKCMQNNGADVIIGNCDSTGDQSKWSFNSTLQSNNPLRRLLLPNFGMNKQIKRSQETAKSFKGDHV